jgi:hypothetical protein
MQPLGPTLIYLFSRLTQKKIVHEELLILHNSLLRRKKEKDG